MTPDTTPRTLEPSARHASATRKDLAAGMVDLDPLIHERNRLGILATLSASLNTQCSYLDLRETLGLTDGNLTTHLRVLEEAGLVKKEKKGAGRGSTTTLKLTTAGAAAFQDYLGSLESLIKTARGA